MHICARAKALRLLAKIALEKFAQHSCGVGLPYILFYYLLTLLPKPQGDYQTLLRLASWPHHSAPFSGSIRWAHCLER